MAKQTKTTDISFQDAFEGIKKFPWPFCDVCQEEVQSMRLFYDEFRQAHIYEAICHGDTEQTIVTDHLLIELGKGRITAGVAFKKTRLTNE
jgi:hypothetical protein